MPMKTMRILLVEDTHDVGEAIAKRFEAIGHAVDWETDGRAEDRVGALDLGADDYLVKPFDFRELEARARVLIRRRTGGEATNLIKCGDIAIDRGARSVHVGKREVQLKRRELTLLEVMAARPGRVFSKDELLDQIFGFDEAANANAIELYVGRLRKKLEGAQARIVTVRGLGYQLVAGDAA